MGVDLPNMQNTSIPHQTLGIWELLVGFRVADGYGFEVRDLGWVTLGAATGMALGFYLGFQGCSMNRSRNKPSSMKDGTDTVNLEQPFFKASLYIGGLLMMHYTQPE